MLTTPLSCRADAPVVAANEGSLLRCLNTPAANEATTYPADDDKKERRGLLRLRLPCPTETDKPLTAMQRFEFKAERASRTVAKLGSTDANRSQFVKWIKSMKVKLSDKDLQQLIGSTVQVSVPCGTVDLL